MSLKWVNKWKWNTQLSADSVEWCPVPEYKNIFSCGTYQLDKQEHQNSLDRNVKQRRIGRIYLLENSDLEKSPIQTIDTSGILDQKWCYHKIQGYPVLAVATSGGCLELHRLAVENDLLQLKFWMRYCLGEDILALSLDWSTNKYEIEEPLLVVSDSTGAVTVLKIADGLKVVGAWKTHGYEAWIAAFNYWDTNVFYSGGDDAVFGAYDVRVPGAPVSVNRSHDAGVTSIRSHVDAEHQILTGSYDDKVRLWDARNLRRCVWDKNLGGGVWRLKWHPHEQNTVLAACMYGGVRVLSVKGGEIVVDGEYLEHESIVYGADWNFDDKVSLVATCSFYDCRLHLSELTSNNKYC